MERPLPDYAIFQNDRNRVSAVWIKQLGEWRVLPETDFAPISIMVNMIRYSPNPEKTLQQIGRSITELGEGGKPCE